MTRLLAAIVLALVLAGSAGADSMILGPEYGYSDDAIKERIQAGWWIFVGRVVGAHEVVAPTVGVRDSAAADRDSGFAASVTGDAPRLSPRFVYRFRVEHIWQGDPRAREIEVGMGGEYLGEYRYGGPTQAVYSFVLGRRYLVFAHGSEGELRTRPSGGSYALGLRACRSCKPDAEVAHVDSLCQWVRHSRRKAMKSNL